MFAQFFYYRYAVKPRHHYVQYHPVVTAVFGVIKRVVAVKNRVDRVAAYFEYLFYRRGKIDFVLRK